MVKNLVRALGPEWCLVHNRGRGVTQPILHCIMSTDSNAALSGVEDGSTTQCWLVANHMLLKIESQPATHLWKWSLVDMRSSGIDVNGGVRVPWA